MTKSSRMLLATLAIAVSVAGCGDDEPAAPAQQGSAAATVEMSSLKFVPAKIDVSAGSEVTFVNRDDADHDAKADPGFHTKLLTNAGDRDTVTLDEPGTYAYFCTVHPFMKGEIVVK